MVERVTAIARAPEIRKHIAGTGVEAADGTAGWQIGDVRDAADVDDDAMPVALAEQRGVKGGNERRALPARRDVAASEIGDHRDARALSHTRGVVQLQRKAALGTMTQRLSVHADGDDAFRRKLRCCERTRDRVGVELRQHVGGRSGARAIRSRRAFATPRARRATLSGTPNARLLRRACDAERRRELGDDGVDAVEARARHDACKQLARIGHSVNCDFLFGRGDPRVRNRPRDGELA